MADGSTVSVFIRFFVLTKSDREIQKHNMRRESRRRDGHRPVGLALCALLQPG